MAIIKSAAVYNAVDWTMDRSSHVTAVGLHKLAVIYSFGYEGVGDGGRGDIVYSKRLR